eukprot:CAMPEP_0170586746 /NCGR_PEP_ID=MMETSP0224-20130122/9909_1 /TAXON_ID=285029 /ORGANISM="Togula jolla, Strain CCCM 725" /LENGTH=536 /DNA_ID=CAMNT_0010910313 /DNA_START=117 /DNA_END=1727 /DNA_ORIENTATION=-
MKAEDMCNPTEATYPRFQRHCSWTSCRRAGSPSFGTAQSMPDRFRREVTDEKIHCIQTVLWLMGLLIASGFCSIIAHLVVAPFARLCIAFLLVAVVVGLAAGSVCVYDNCNFGDVLGVGARRCTAAVAFCVERSRRQVLDECLPPPARLVLGLLLAGHICVGTVALLRAMRLPLLLWLSGFILATLFIKDFVVYFRSLCCSMKEESGRQALILHGVAIAQLQARFSLKLGQHWWLHHGRQDTTYPPLDPRRNWEASVVSELLGSSFSIRRLSSVDGGEEEEWDAATSINEVEGSAIPFETVQLSLQFHSKSTQETLGLAKKTLRCIEWARITEELFDGAICGDESSVSGFFNLSRDLMPGEVIDFFVSQSWHDAPGSKWLALKALVTEFRRCHGRDPTFWIDKACIDQTRLHDFLPLLPVYLMSCSKVLVLLGATYMKRLNCVWELFVLLSSPKTSASERITLYPLQDERGCMIDLCDEFQNFSIQDTHCYDPNEELKLHSAMSTFGATSFNEELGRLASKCQAVQRKGRAAVFHD